MDGFRLGDFGQFVLQEGRLFGASAGLRVTGSWQCQIGLGFRMV